MEPTPFRILLRENDWVARKETAQALYESQRTESLELLQESLAHPDERIRLFAAQALGKISERQERRVNALRAEVKKEPKNYEKRLNLARVLGQVAVLLSESKESQDHIFREAVDELVELLRVFPTRQDILLELGQIYWLWGKLAEADQIFQKIKKDAPEFTAASFRRAEIAMKQNRPERIRPLLEKIRHQALPPAFQEAVRYWCD